MEISSFGEIHAFIGAKKSRFYWRPPKRAVEKIAHLLERFKEPLKFTRLLQQKKVVHVRSRSVLNGALRFIIYLNGTYLLGRFQKTNVERADLDGARARIRR